MPREFTRKDRVSDALQRELSRLIRDEVRDPRLKMTNITGVEVSRDLSSAKVYVTFIGSNSEEAGHDATAILNGAVGFLRTRIASEMKLRVTPKIRFIYDITGKRGQDLAALIEQSIYLDEKHKFIPSQTSEKFDEDV
ncbi:MAG: 30S ribosome-binding factor RbfA [Cellvibrionales bacterium]|jgi:ribosome-binding factor A|nr:30S ribosome-binding factor RbfA [Cellvibrionales bacterium]MCH9797824.1 30S ribosome-binding factor RbfA [Gammaproteobacteria bacterium]MCH9843269.1 30S ribosome-binding factor RbfA [Gammaproteobacteria bacterium]MDA7737019.1 30S ribosome-binding factor RbfA [Porticoccus sp.]MDC0412288.1 30S ribosome-binding factor RbfA [Porticoccus sp.]